MASTPFKFDHVGSFLRPESLKKARRDYEAGSITAEELKSVEDEAITKGSWTSCNNRWRVQKSHMAS